MSRIVAIERVVDTRDWEEVADGKFAPVPGSGNPRPCDHCGREHEVHVYVKLDDGSTMIVGSSCAKGDIAAPIKRAVARQHTLDRARAEWHAAVVRAEAAERAWQKVQRMQPPLLEQPEQGVFVMGDVTWKHRWRDPVRDPFDERDVRSMQLNWREKRMAELGFERGAYHYKSEAQALEDRLRRLERRSLGRT
jgi:hypothetical protein